MKHGEADIADRGIAEAYFEFGGGHIAPNPGIDIHHIVARTQTRFGSFAVLLIIRADDLTDIASEYHIAGFSSDFVVYLALILGSVV